MGQARTPPRGVLEEAYHRAIVGRCYKKGVRVALLVAGVGVVWFFSTAIFERYAPRRFVRIYQKFLGNPVFRPVLGLVPGWAVIETIGSRTGRPHQVPVGGRLRGKSFWLVAGDWKHAQYVRNINANPSVRVRVHGRWRTGTAHLLPSDNVRRRLWRLNPVNSLFVWLANRDTLTIRIDLE